ncbi:MAG: putative hydroxymethylpyrimidine transport system substrate-binding protein [Solirubrobacteraceae bacterium]|jgi:ABC-type nitrate/sulfonate/bicarbonate transport system substrate-binding protein|nr:putative hydroxymethylpyrimidine transport system substrate-binding protein [Solirubrobacteraceae bacterium]
MDRRLAIAFVLAVAVAPALGACGPAQEDRAPNSAATLVLDSRPAAVHTGIYMAVARGYDQALGVTLHVRAPDHAGPVKAISSGRAQFAVLDIHDLAIARDRGLDLVGVMALVQTPLAAILAQPSIRTPRQLEGHRVGVTRGPAGRAVLRSIVAGAGGDPAKVSVTRIGSGATVAGLLAGRVAGVETSWATDGVALQAQRPAIREFRVEDFGAPAYPELVLAVTRQTLQDEPNLVRATVAALSRGYSEVLADPESGVSALEQATGARASRDLQGGLDAVSPSFREGVQAFGELVPARLRAWARWEQRLGIVKRLPDVGRAFDGRYVPPDGRD